MSYVSTFGDERAPDERIVSDELVDELEPYERAQILIQREQLEEAQRGRFWNHLATFATAFVPLATFFGLHAALSIGKDKKK